MTQPIEWGVRTSDAADALGLLTVGEEVYSRKFIASSLTHSSGTGRATFFKARKTERITQVRSVSISAAATPTLTRVGVYTAVDNGDGTASLQQLLSATDPADTTLWAAVNTIYTRPLLAPINKVKGTLYAVMCLFVGTTAPTLQCNNTSLFGAIGAEAPMLGGFVPGLADLPAGPVAVSQAGAYPYVELLP